MKKKKNKKRMKQDYLKNRWRPIKLRQMNKKQERQILEHIQEMMLGKKTRKEKLISVHIQVIKMRKIKQRKQILVLTLEMKLMKKTKKEKSTQVAIQEMKQRKIKRKKLIQVLTLVMKTRMKNQEKNPKTKPESLKRKWKPK